MLLTIDVGNTVINIGLFEDEDLKQHWRIETRRTRTSDEYGVFLSNLTDNFSAQNKTIEGIIITSVVPPVTTRLMEMAEKFYNLRPYLVQDLMEEIMPIEVEHREEVGSDRVVNSFIAKEKYGTPAIVIDMGTAVTYDVVSPEGAYLGGVISPGLQISMEALFSRTALLPTIRFKKPPSVLGRKTSHAIQSGLYFGQLSQILGVTKSLEEVLDKPAKKILTGGWAKKFHQEDLKDFIIEPNLTLFGLQMIYSRFCILK